MIHDCNETKTCLCKNVRRWKSVFGYLEAKTFSLNEAIAAESANRHSEATNTPQLSEKTSERFSLNKLLTLPSLKRNKLKKPGLFSLVHEKRQSPFKYRKTFGIRSPLKPRKLKRSPKLRNKRRNQISKSKYDENAILDQKYIPLLKTIGMLFDNLLGTDQSSSEEYKSRKHRRNKYRTLFFENDSGIGCACHKSSFENESETIQAPSSIKDSTASTTVPTGIEIAETTSTTADYPTTSDISSIRHDQNLPLLLPRNSHGYQRNSIRNSERSSPTRDRSAEGHFTWNNGDNEYDSKFREDGSITEDDDEIPDSTSRNSSSSNRLDRRWGSQDVRGSEVSGDWTDLEDYQKQAYKIRRGSGKYKEENKLETGGNKTESTKSVPKHLRRLRGPIPEKKNVKITNDIHSKEDDEKIKQHNSTSHQGILVGNGTNTTQNKKVRPRNEAMMFVKSSTGRQNTIQTNNSDKKSPVVMIIDGYSVTRNKNGENKVSNKSIHMHS
ncbi:uncharacterized protein LOC101742680 isoform X2 [Bombyx mori]|uniref:uncharacterized protein LOC101742680 isoform X2 n=1 Tax=Bombyx mori TaxID=7091 RepID=UPI002ED64FDD